MVFLKKIVMLERSTEIREMLKQQFSLLHDSVAVYDVHDSEQLVSYVASHEFDYAIVELEALSPLFEHKPHLLNAIAGKTRIIFITTGLSPLTRLSMVSRKLEIYDKATEFSEMLSSINKHLLFSKSEYDFGHVN